MVSSRLILEFIMTNRYIVDIVYPFYPGGSETYVIYDNYQGKYISEHYTDSDMAFDDCESLNEGEEIENYREFG